jgi:hypothetical protein
VVEGSYCFSNGLRMLPLIFFFICSREFFEVRMILTRIHLGLEYHHKAAIIYCLNIAFQWLQFPQI